MSQENKVGKRELYFPLTDKYVTEWPALNKIIFYLLTELDPLTWPGWISGEALASKPVQLGHKIAHAVASHLDIPERRSVPIQK